MSGVTRSIRLPIAPAGPKTCGKDAPAGRYDRCPFSRWSREPSDAWRCLVFRPAEAIQLRGGRLLRWPECIAAEVEDGSST